MTSQPFAVTLPSKEDITPVILSVRLVQHAQLYSKRILIVHVQEKRLTMQTLVTIIPMLLFVSFGLASEEDICENQREFSAKTVSTTGYVLNGE